jgi:hypothetical protein
MLLAPPIPPAAVAEPAGAACHVSQRVSRPRSARLGAMSARREQALVLGEVAETYHRVRPGYPDALVDDVFAFGMLEPGDRAVEVGAGTGKAVLVG